MYKLCRFTARRMLLASLKLIGAKNGWRDKLYCQFPEHTVYIEPFLGTGGVLIGKVPAQIEIVGDLNTYLIGYYKLLQDDPMPFYLLMRKWHAELIEYDAAAEAYFEHLKRAAVSSEDELTRAVCFYLITKHCFNGIWRLNEKGEVNSAWGKKLDGRGIFTEPWIKKVSERVKKVEFHNRRYQYLISQARHAVLKGGHSTFVFLDPPYHDCATTYNGEYFTDADFKELALQLQDAPFKWMMTINDDAFVRDLFGQYDMISHKVFYPCNVKGSARKKQPELMIANYPLKRRPPNYQLKLFED